MAASRKRRAHLEAQGFAIDRPVAAAQPALMKPKEIHDLLLSLFIRGLGFWVLYLSTDTFFTIVDHVTALLSPDRDMHRPMWAFESDAIWMAAKLAVAAYLILGAPPFLKWATHDRGSR